LVGLADVRRYRPGHTVLAQGEEAGLFLVVDGHIAFRRTTVDGREVIPLVASSGQLGAILSITGRPAATESIALSPCTVALFRREDLDGLAANDAGLALDLLDHVLVTFEAMIERLDGLLYQNASRRVARVLEDHAALFFDEEAVLTRGHLPALVGTSREMTGRVLRRLEADGIVTRVGRDRVRLLDPVGLATLAASRSPARTPGRRNKFLANRSTAGPQ
jgi:CRP-like cAMP-binding protein